MLLDLDIELSLEYHLISEKVRPQFYDYLQKLIDLCNNKTNEKEMNEIIKVLNNNNYFNNLFKRPKRTLKQIYINYMKHLFTFNNFWSKRKIFFPKRYNTFNNDTEIKYKQINYYTKNLQFPFFYPILEFEKYCPNFKSYNGKFFKENKDKILEYNFNFEINNNIEKTIKRIAKSDTFISEKCCLIKNTHHVIGSLNVVDKYNENKITIVFKYIRKNNINEHKNCNQQKEENTINQLCYGATFLCPDKEYKRNIIIKSKDILFILIREYFHRLSGIEIFTINKSYYFNFQNVFDFKNILTNKVLNEIKHTSCFNEIKINNKFLLGYYNIKYKHYLFPLFDNEINVWNNWNNKVLYYNNYDLISFINIFSNRSFRDVFQYPIFPMLYNSIGYNRQMNEHIGFQTLNEESKERKELLLTNYIYKQNDKENDGEEDICLYNIHYSNPPFIFNYLLRVFPYSFLAIEFQGDNFDDPNRCFYSIESTLLSNLSDKSDLREMIPELYYMIELFYNKNNILFEKLKNGDKIDDVLIKSDEKIELDINRRENYAKFLFLMRKSLEEEKDINKWIDLIFGVNKNNCKIEGHIYNYYKKNSQVNFNNDLSILKDDFTMDKVNFGLLPYQLFKKEFPKKNIENKKKIYTKLNNLNKILFEDEHIKIRSPIQTFLCKGRFLLDENYIKIINPKNKYNLNKLEYYYNIPHDKKVNIYEINNNFYNKMFGDIDMEVNNNNNIYKDNMSLVDYYFVGNIFVSISIYTLLKKDEKKKEEEEKNMNIQRQRKETIKKMNESYKNKNTENKKSKEETNTEKKAIYNIISDSKFLDEKLDLQITLINKLYDHTKEIKYIDFNPRLNILLSYSLDEFINIYIFPKCKLINTIDTISFKVEKDRNYFDEVVLISYPFPSIICHNNEYIYYLSINGELIKYDKLLEGEKIIFSIDKNLGISKDKVGIKNNDNTRCIFNYFKQ